MSQEAPRLLVVDASVAAKWYLPEELSGEATLFLEAGVRGEARLVAPSLLQPELRNVLWQRHRRGEVSPERIREVWTAFEAAPLSLVEPGPLMPAAIEIAIRYRCTVYDAVYVALAEAGAAEGAAMLTADSKLVARFTDTPFAGRIQPLAPS